MVASLSSRRRILRSLILSCAVRCLQIFSKQVTHVICGKPNRGEKYLGGCALGKWVLQKDFVEDSVKQGRWLNEEKYEWTSSALAEGSPEQLRLLYEAPRKWRTGLQKNEGAFKNWFAFVHVQDNKMKKAYERLLEAGDATVYKKKISFQNTPKDLTHVFVEPNLRRDVQHLESKGVAVNSIDLIPEYIIQISKETLAESNTKLKCSKLFSTITMPKKTSNKEKHAAQRPGVLLGKENSDITKHELKSKEHAGKKGIKRHIAECDLCGIKRRRITVQDHLPFSISLKSTQPTQKAKRLIFPRYVSNILESCIDESCLHLGMESVTSSLSSTQAPTSQWLHIIMEQFLLNSPTEIQALQSYQLLQNILAVHPPNSAQSLYLDALAEANQDSQGDERNTVTPWDFVSKIIRHSLDDKLQNEEQKRTQSNAGLLLKFLDNLFKHGGCGQSPSIVTRILWPTASVCQSSTQAKEFVVLCCTALRLSAVDDSKLFISQILLDMLSLAVTSTKHGDVTGQACESLAQQLFIEISRTECFEAIKLLIQGCQSQWLKMRLLELALENFDKRLIPQEYKHLLNKTLSLNKIVLCYFFLLPNMNGSEKAKELEKATQIISKWRRKNGKGETPLHLACIHNNAAKVEEILKQEDIDVNVVDNAGWTSLHEACNRGHVECVQKILEYHEQTNKVNLLTSPEDGVTVLHDAVLNNHLPVVKLLLCAGGLELLKAKTSNGMTALQLSQNTEISQFIKSEMNKLQALSLDQSYIQRPLPENYIKTLTSNTQKQFIPMIACEKYLFYLSQITQAYVKEMLLMAKQSCKNYCSNCKTDVACCLAFSEHITNLERHLKLLSGEQNLSQLCELYITSMKLCISFVK